MNFYRDFFQIFLFVIFSSYLLLICHSCFNYWDQVFHFFTYFAEYALGIFSNSLMKFCITSSLNTRSFFISCHRVPLHGICVPFHLCICVLMICLRRVGRSYIGYLLFPLSSSCVYLHMLLFLFLFLVLTHIFVFGFLS